MCYEENCFNTKNFRPKKYIFLVISMKIGIHENKAIHSIFMYINMCIYQHYADQAKVVTISNSLSISYCTLLLTAQISAFSIYLRNKCLFSGCMGNESECWTKKSHLFVPHSNLFLMNPPKRHSFTMLPANTLWKAFFNSLRVINSSFRQ